MEDSILDHPEFKKLQDIGLGDISQQHRTFVIYLDLVEVKGWYNVELLPVAKLETVFVCGHPSSTEELCLVWPISATTTLSMRHIATVLQEMQAEHSMSKIMLGIVDADSTVVYYRLSSELTPPEPPHEQQASKDRQRRKMRRRRARQQQVYQV